MSRPCSFQSVCYLFALFLFTAGGPALAQQDPLQVRNPIPWGSYQDSQIDTVNLLNGSLAFHIPLYSLPQRGQLSLSFSLKGTSPAYGFATYTCTANNGLGPCFTGGFTWNNKLTLVLDQALSAGVAQYRYPANSNTFYNVYSIADSNGSTHEVGYDNSNPQLLRATDGTGFLYNPTLTPPYTPFLTDWGLGTIYTPSGIQHIHGTSAYTIRDADGNSIAMAMNCCGITQITDSLNRTIPPPPTTAASTSTTGCPAVTALYQATTGSSTWVVPGPNGTQLTFLLCYTSIYDHTDFFGGCLNHSNNCSGNYDGDGTITNVLQAVVLPNLTYYLFTYGAANPSDSTSYGYADLTQIRLPSGGTINYQYANLPSTCTTASGCANHVVIGVNAARGVSNRVLDPGNGGQQASWTYAYTDYNSNTATVTDFQGNDTVLTFSYLGGSAGSPNCSNGNSSSVPYETEQQVYKGPHTSGTILLTKDTSYQITCGNPQSGTWRGSASIIAVLPTQVKTTLDNGLITTTTRQYNDGGYVDVQPACTAGANNSFTCTWSATQQVPFGLATSTITTDYGGATLRTVNTQYLFQQNSSYYPGNFLNQVASTTTLNGSGTQVAKTTYGYDENNGSPQGLFAHQTSVNRWLNTTNTNITSKNVYNNQGMVTQSIDPLLKATTLTYDSTGAFLSQVQYPTTAGVTHIEHLSIDPNTGLTTSHTDQNGKVTSTQYDVMRRITQVNYPDGGQTTNCYTDMGGSTCTQSAPPFHLVTTQLATPDPSIVRTTVFDGLGRVSQTQLNSDPDCASGDKTDTTYDGLSRMYTVSNPYCTTSDSTYGKTTYTYDALGRTCVVAPPMGTPQSNCPSGAIAGDVVTVYGGRATEVFDEGNGTQSVARISQTDGLDRVVSVCEVTGTSLIGSGGTPGACGQDIAATGFLTTYQYDALDNLLQVNQSGVGTRTFNYDSLSRLTSAGNPESGTTSYAYDSNGNVHTKTDARNITTTYGYDALNRLTGKTYSDGTPAVTLGYDQTSAIGVTLTNTIGRRSSESTAGSLPTGSVFSYDSMGRIADNSQCTPQNCGTGVFALQYPQYDFLGDLISGTNAVGVTFTYSYNGAARLTGISSNYVDPSHPGTLFSQATYKAPGLLKTVLLGNGLTETRDYNSRLQLTSLTAGTVYSLSMGSYAPNGDVLAANDSVNGNWVYKYDDFNRLICSNLASNGTCSAPTSGTATYTYKYDRFGNRWQQNGPNSMQLTFTGNNPGNPQNNNRMDGYSYDAAGNLLNDGTHNYSYDAENRIFQVDNGSTASYVYDAEGRRVRKTTSAGSLDFLYDTEGHKVAEVDTTGTFQRGELYASGRHFAVFAPDPGPNGAAFFIHADWLGTERARTNLTGTACETITSLPFGDGQTISDNCGDSAGDVSPMHFTGKERDPESGLDNFGARYNASSFGRFMSPDPFGGHQEDPQTLNRYAYVRNNPLNLTDPTGLDFYLNCEKNNGTTCQGGHQYYKDKDGNYQETIVKSDKNGILTDQSGNKYTATVDAGGVHFSSDSGKTSSTGSWVNGSNETKFTQQTGALAGFRFDFSQPGKGQSFSGTFSADTNFYGVKSALKDAGFSVSYLDQCCNFYEMYHNWSLINFRSAGDPNTGQNSVHFLVNPGDKVGLVVPTTGKFHGYEINPNTDPLGHLRELP